MAFDGFAVKCIAQELRGFLQGGRVDKIYMPDNDTVVMGVRSLGKNYKLLLSCNPSLPRVHLTEHSRENPAVPPVFCMLLRKHLAGGRILSVSQPGMERVIDLAVESRTELGDTVTKRLILEIMGRHSNIILVHHDGKIADSMRRVDASVSSVRLVLPGLLYAPPPPQDKISPLEVAPEEIVKTLYDCPNERKMDKYILECFAGLGPAIAREAVYRGVGRTDAVYMEISRTQLERLAQVLNEMFAEVRENNFSPVIVYDDDKKPMDFSAVRLTQYADQQPIPCLSDRLDLFFMEKETRERMNARSSDLHKTVSNLLERTRRKAQLQRESIEEAEQMERFRLFGDLITANIYQIKKGDKRLLAMNFYDENQSEMEIPLEAELSPSENAQKYYTRYNKLKNTAAAAKIQLENSLRDLEYLESVQTAIENCDQPKELSEIKAELASEGYVRQKAVKGKPKKEQQSTQPAKFTSADGFEILVGKNNRQNDYLTLKLAKGHDIWLHTKNIPGSHTIIVTGRKEVPQTTIAQAGMLAAYFSKARASQNVPVDYARVSDVKKPSGAKPGMVIYTDNKTVYVTPDENAVKELMM